jgi:hypothetical protein
MRSKHPFNGKPYLAGLLPTAPSLTDHHPNESPASFRKLAIEASTYRYDLLVMLARSEGALCGC